MSHRVPPAAALDKETNEQSHRAGGLHRVLGNRVPRLEVEVLFLVEVSFVVKVLFPVEVPFTAEPLFMVEVPFTLEVPFATGASRGKRV